MRVAAGADLSKGWVLLGAPSSIGIRPYDDSGLERELHRAPTVLRGLRVAERTASEDLGDVVPPSYRDFFRPAGGVRNETELVTYSRALADAVAAGSARGQLLVLGGDCSIVLGNLLAFARTGRRMGLVYVDAHADFATPPESTTGSAAGMCLGLALGRGDSPLARLNGAAALVRGEDVVLAGRRDDADLDAVRGAGILDLPDLATGDAAGAAAAAALARVAREELDGFWIHVDADVLDPGIMPAVDSPEPGGGGVETLVHLLRPLATHPRALGLQLTIYDPGLDDTGAAARSLVDLLAAVTARSVTAM
jgi:arginase